MPQGASTSPVAWESRCIPSDGGNAAVLLKHADSAMYRAKELGRDSCQFFTTELNERLTERQAVQRGLAKALEHQEFELYYQPRVDANRCTDRGC